LSPLGKTLQPNESPTIVETWKEMEKLLDTGKVKSIGVSNFGVSLLKQLADDPSVKVVPAANQIELHPFLPVQPLQEYAKVNNIVLTAYSPIGGSSHSCNITNSLVLHSHIPCT
jgi:glycerol 2-dehydrogenase (NADP+)